MSLSSHLANGEHTWGSPVKAYLMTVAGILEESKQGSEHQPHAAAIVGLNNISVEVRVPTKIAPRKLSTMGTAFDYRLRFRFAKPKRTELIPWQMINVFTHGRTDTYKGRTFSTFFDHLEDLIKTLKPYAGPLSNDDELLLCRYCVTLANMEAQIRSHNHYYPTWRTAWNETNFRTDPLLAVGNIHQARDIKNLMRSAEHVLAEQIIDAHQKTTPFVPNPTFNGSLDVGGADADFIIGDTLYELKTTTVFRASSLRDAFRQNVGYALLDYTDQYRIRNVAVYFARQETVIKLPIWTLIFPPGDVRSRYTTSGELIKAPTPTQILRSLTKHRTGLHKAATGKWINYEAMAGYTLPPRCEVPRTYEQYRNEKPERQRAALEKQRCQTPFEERAPFEEQLFELKYPRARKFVDTMSKTVASRLNRDATYELQCISNELGCDRPGIEPSLKAQNLKIVHPPPEWFPTLKKRNQKNWTEPPKPVGTLRVYYPLTKPASEYVFPPNETIIHKTDRVPDTTWQQWANLNNQINTTNARINQIYERWEHGHPELAKTLKPKAIRKNVLNTHPELGTLFNERDHQEKQKLSLLQILAKHTYIATLSEQPPPPT